MAYRMRQEVTIGFGGPLTPGVKSLLIANGVAFLLQALIRSFSSWFWLSPPTVLPPGFQLWRLGTYMFLHGGMGHLIFNMLALFMFGCSVERMWGTKLFVRYYVLCGLGAALLAFLPFGPFYSVPILGASGAIYGILLAYGVLFPHNQIWVLMTFPVEARYLVIVWGFVAFVGSLVGGDGVAHIVHLGGLLTGLALIRWSGFLRSSRGSGEVTGSLREFYRRWRMKRLRKKFEAYYEKRSGGGNDPNMVH
ncbi:MAG TPA: rhomboid family intramembrane serine protease [Vicinamibacteria bacterium]